ncbi:MAG: HesA/MoeB/ThiF family protein [Pseudomonadota bacterium]
MIVVVALGVLLWGIGRMADLPVRGRWILVALLYLAVLAVNIALPDGHPLREMTGGSPRDWMVVGGMVAVVLAYRQGLGWLRARVRPENRGDVAVSGRQGRSEIERNARHIALREIGGPGQASLKSASVLVVGAGGLGSAALQALGAAGIGRIGIVDPDVVEVTNLQRQSIHTDDRIGMPKVFSAQAALKAQNPYLDVRPYNRRLTAEIAQDLMSDYDLVLDGTDDVETRYVINAAAVATETPLISAAISQWEGQIGVFAPAEGGPCYACTFPVGPKAGLAPSCAEAGVLGPLPAVFGALMAAEAVKWLTGAGEPLAGRLLIYDAQYAESRIIKTPRRLECSVCGDG